VQDETDSLHQRARFLRAAGHHGVLFARRDELHALKEGTLSARREVRRGERRSSKAEVDGDVADGRARNEVGKLRGARESRPLLEEAVHERGRRVEAAERGPEDDPDVCGKQR
jgi:hypothetical protein